MSLSSLEAGRTWSDCGAEDGQQGGRGQGEDGQGPNHARQLLAVIRIMICILEAVGIL